MRWWGLFYKQVIHLLKSNSFSGGDLCRSLDVTTTKNSQTRFEMQFNQAKSTIFYPLLARLKYM